MSWIDQGRQYHGYFGHGTAPQTDADDVEDAANGAVGLLPPADRIRYERWLRCGGMATLQCAAPVLFGPGGVAAVSGSGPTAAGLAKAIRTKGLDRWPRVVAAAAEQASAEAEVTLPPGHYFAPLMNQILAVRPGDDVSALRRAISDAFYAKGDTVGGNQVTAQLSDMTEEGGNLAVRRGVADELAHYARTDPEQVALFRTGLVGGALASATAATAEGLATAKTSWGNPSSLAEHFADHGTDFGATSAEDYAKQAAEFLRRAQRDALPMKIDEGGTIRVYDPATNTFGSYNADGTTKRFLNQQAPHIGIVNLVYDRRHTEEVGMSYTCPVCGYPDLDEKPRGERRGGSYEICPSCGFEFGVTDDDRGFTFEQWRQQWIENGAKWQSDYTTPLQNWNPTEQLKNVLDK